MTDLYRQPKAFSKARTFHVLSLTLYDIEDCRFGEEFNTCPEGC